MLLPRVHQFVRRWVTTLKFKIVLIAVVTALLSAAVTVHLMLAEVLLQSRNALLQREAEDRERTAMLVARRLDVLQTALGAVAERISPALLAERAALTRYLVDKPSVAALFNTLFVIGMDGRMVVRLQAGQPNGTLADLADREYWIRLRATGLPVVSKLVIGRVSGKPEVIFAVPIRNAAGELIGALGAGLRVQNNELLASLGRDLGLGIARDLVIDSDGRIVAHDEPGRLLGSAADEPGFAEAYRQWADAGRTVHAEGVASLSQAYLVSMAGVPMAGWMIVRLTPEVDALRPLAAASATAWRAAALVGLSAAVLAGGLAWAMTQPISRLRSRAEQLLADADVAGQPWPGGQGEVGELSRAFQHVIEQRQARQDETQALLLQLEAVLDNAEVGIAFSRNHRFELVSPHFCRIFGWDRALLRGQPLRAVYASDEAAAAAEERTSTAFRAQGAFEGEVELVRRSGEAFWAHVRARLVATGEHVHDTIWIIEDVTAARDQRERLAWTATHDSLTGLTNRAAFEVLLERATERCADEPFCALFIDLDEFKAVNDNAGHAAGDALLRELSRQLGAQVRQTDTVARLGGDEFAVLLPRCPASQAVLIAEKLRVAVASHTLRWEGREFRVAASIGLVPVVAGFASHSDVIRAADEACYVAKRSGRNRVVVHTP